MIKENEEQSIREYGNRKKRYKRRRNFIITTLLLALVIVGAVYIIKLYNRSYQSYEVQKTVDVPGENAAGYLSYGEAVVKYSKDGAVAIDKDGNLLWNVSYNMSDPIADTCGKYVVIADRGSNTINVLNGKGSAGSYSTAYDIIKVEVASQGVVAALMEEGEKNFITLYDLDGTDLGEIETTVSGEGYPLDISLSDDGKKLVTSFLTISNGTVIDKVSFYNYGEVGQNMTDRFVGGWAFDEGIIVPRVAFVNNDTVCIYKNDGFKIYSMEQIPSNTFEKELEGRIQSILYNDKYTGVVLEALEGTSKHLILYDLSGKKVLDKVLDFDYDNIFMTDEEIIMYGKSSCIVMKTNGKVKFRSTFEGNLEGFYPINNLDRYFLVNETKVSELLLKE
jgi:hypothetical protein